MAVMSGELIDVLINVACWWLAVFIGYGVLLLGVDGLLQRFARRRARQQRERDALARLAAERTAAINRIGVAFLAAQQLIRDEANARKGARR
ncbi:hypothetical protein [Mycolicibacterium grossiae]|uniref:Uncharacterized protein n=1 Tax=Mycolicibacterium grossiae TaxID=1552759 RepID=A0A1E8PW61_9MYCO|nr:hypothetical protein [Mycolicibacterium grossiae]OFJ50572.1 hypothetical protein BEL07_27470 [Mycolicibacterium grossiae]QEM43529.1 hypothetical protein FZ046_00930 [Mycolicibacterium grossiae]